MTKREKRFWKYKVQCKPLDFANSNIEELRLNMMLPDLTDEELGYLCPYMEKVKELHLTDTYISDDGIALLTDLPNLQYLRMKDTRITSECIPHLLKIPNLNHLHLGSIDASCEELLPLAEIKTLKTLIAKPKDMDETFLSVLHQKRPDLELVIHGTIFPV